MCAEEGAVSADAAGKGGGGGGGSLHRGCGDRRGRGSFRGGESRSHSKREIGRFECRLSLDFNGDTGYYKKDCTTHQIIITCMGGKGEGGNSPEDKVGTPGSEKKTGKNDFGRGKKGKKMTKPQCEKRRSGDLLWGGGKEILGGSRSS